MNKVTLPDTSDTDNNGIPEWGYCRDALPLLLIDEFSDRKLSYSAWLAREREHGRPTQPGMQPHNAGITPGYRRPRRDDHVKVTRGELRQVLSALRRELRQLAAAVAALEDRP
jgi:hypothetical protein